MTNKELKKLSRLELLELLLEASRENEALKEKIEKLKEENERAKSIQSLSATAKELNDALSYVKSVAEKLSENADGQAGDNKAAKQSTALRTKKTPEKEKPNKDIDLYCNIISYYTKNSQALNSLPDEIREPLKERIKEILENRS